MSWPRYAKVLKDITREDLKEVWPKGRYVYVQPWGNHPEYFAIIDPQSKALLAWGIPADALDTRIRSF